MESFKHQRDFPGVEEWPTLDQLSAALKPLTDRSDAIEMMTTMYRCLGECAPEDIAGECSPVSAEHVAAALTFLDEFDTCLWQLRRLRERIRNWPSELAQVRLEALGNA